MKCEIPGCPNSSIAKGLCNKHRLQIKKWGCVKRTRFDANEIVIKGNFARIRLYDMQGNERKEMCLIDIEDVPKIEGTKWRYNWGYCTSDKESIQERILGVKTTRAMVIDHLNGNKLDNRKQNLRYCPHAVNLQNCKIRTDNSSGCPGVHFLEKKKCWQVYINVKGKRINLGYFKEKEKAIEARKKAEQTYFEDKIPHV